MKRRDILKALVVLPIVPITFVDSSIRNAELRVIIKEFNQAGYKVTKNKDSSKTFYCLLHPKETYYYIQGKKADSWKKVKRPLEIGIFERIDKRFISEIKRDNEEYRIDGCSGYDVPKQSEIGTYIFGNLDGTLPKQFEHLFSHIEYW